MLLKRRLRSQPAPLAKDGENVDGSEGTRGDASLRRIDRKHQQNCSVSSQLVLTASEGMLRHSKHVSAIQREVSVATTCAAIASPRPIASTPSLVLALR